MSAASCRSRNPLTLRRSPVSEQNAMVALAMAIDCAENKPAPPELLGWL